MLKDCYNPFNLEGRTVLVTGASSGIGQATAVECARLGAKLVITGRDPERLRQTFDRLEGACHRQILAELKSADDLARLVQAVPALNGVAFCAGVNRILPFALCTQEKANDIFQVNFSAPLELLRRLLAAKKVADAGSVVFVSSVASVRGGAAAGNTLYGASKAALDAAVRQLVREYGPRLRFNTVNPGQVDTPLVRKIREKLTREQIAAALSDYPLGRFGEPEDVAHGIAYLLSPAASWVTGQHLVIDGGLTV